MRTSEKDQKMERKEMKKKIKKILKSAAEVLWGASFNF